MTNKKIIENFIALSINFLRKKTIDEFITSVIVMHIEGLWTNFGIGKIE